MFEILQEAGPYSTPLCAAMALVIGWLLKDRDRLLGILDVANADRLALREQRAEDLVKGRDEYLQLAQSSHEVMREWTSKADTLIAAVRQGGSA